jgi:hypothetical protein
MNSANKQLLIKAAIVNGLLWTSILLIATYIFKGGLFLNYAPFWFLFFASTGALRKYNQLNNGQ